MKTAMLNTVDGIPYLHRKQCRIQVLTRQQNNYFGCGRDTINSRFKVYYSRFKIQSLNLEL